MDKLRTKYGLFITDYADSTDCVIPAKAGIHSSLCASVPMRLCPSVSKNKSSSAKPIPKLKTKDLKLKTPPCASVFSVPSVAKKFGFTLVEVLIVVAILGILAAIVVPLYEDNQQKAKESAAKENLRVLRNAIELYAAQHKGVPPGYPSDDPTKTPNSVAWAIKFLNNKQYLSAPPQNPFNGLANARVLLDGDQFPENATGQYGWIYKPSTKQIRLDWPEKDSQGNIYYEY